MSTKRVSKPKPSTKKAQPKLEAELRELADKSRDGTVTMASDEARALTRSIPAAEVAAELAEIRDRVFTAGVRIGETVYASGDGAARAALEICLAMFAVETASLNLLQVTTEHLGEVASK